MNLIQVKTLTKIIKIIIERKFQSMIVFNFNWQECKKYEIAMLKLDFNNDEEKEVVKDILTIKLTNVYKWDGQSH
uniref:Uncharacterized protein n=1 Tax=Physcomitrium patens TaxID=3218 RepID=A0A2K1KMI2_PHYPA|nr:hypothetical protein PHYPA_005874 [Physcomitrium patens]